MVHQYKNNGYNIVLDVNSGAIHVVDDVSYDVIALYEDHTPEEIVAELSGTYSEAEVKEACEEVASLVKDGELFTKDEYENYIMDFKKRPTVVKALCLHIAHDCNLACRYCFAEEGEYHGHRELMSYEVGKKALDFLIANSGSRRNLEVDFFGGEPLPISTSHCDFNSLSVVICLMVRKNLLASSEVLSIPISGRRRLPIYCAITATLTERSAIKRLSIRRIL